MVEVEAVEGPRQSFKVYDCPLEVWNKYAAWARLYEGNSIWRVMAKAMSLLEQSKADLPTVEGMLAHIQEYNDAQVQTLTERIASLEQDLADLKKKPVEVKQIKGLGGVIGEKV